MSKKLNPYQIHDLQAAADAVAASIPGVVVELDLTGTNVKTAQGTLPEVEFTVLVNGQKRRAGTHPVVTVGKALAGALKSVAGNPNDPAFQQLAQNVENCPVT